MIGKTISHYKILEKLGGGGMGVVYKAEDTKLKRLVALKFLPMDLTRDDEAKERFIHEAQAAAALDHPNICDVHEIGETEDGQLFIVMAYYDGETLKKKVASGKLQVADVIEIAIQISQGLAKAHEYGITHRDIKPANVMITKDGVAKILDFGLAKLAGQSGLTKAGTTLGTVAYMSPEQAHGEDVDHRADIWAFGVVLYEMLTGQLPFKGEYEQAMIYSILNETPQSVSSLRANVPTELERIVNLCLVKKATDRYQQMTDLLADLRALKETLEYGASKRSLAGTAPPRRTRVYLYGAGVVVLALLVWYFFLRPKTPTIDRKSIAVLPFANLSESKEDEYFSDGITEDILTQLSKIADLRVISRTSVMQYKGTKKSIREIGNELNVATILEGSVRRAENQVRIVAQLIDARNDEHLWAETYDQEFTQIFAIQSDVAEKIAAALQAKLSPAEKERIGSKPTANLTAYEYYLRGRDYYCHYNKQDNETAISLFKNALEFDPNYAQAWAGLGDAYAQRYGRFFFPLAWLDSAITVSQKAIALDPNAAEGFKALGTTYIYKGLPRQAFEAFQQAVERNPNYYPAIANLGLNYLMTGSLAEALRWQKKAVAINPAAINHYGYIGESYRRLDMPLQAEQCFKKAIELQPDFADTYFFLALLYLAQSRDEQAKEQVEKMAALVPGEIRIIEGAGQIYGLMGNFAAAKPCYQRALQIEASVATDPRSLCAIGLGHVLLKEGQQQQAHKLLDSALSARIKAIDAGSSEDSEIFYYTAAIYAIRNNKAEAYKWLQKAIDAGWRDYRTALRDPWFENLRGDDRFKQMTAQVKTQVEEMRQRVEEMEKE
jgi:TolB-like protein/Tfp pilus assembly protein PilF/predicted Ser/Thr protein kinase